MFPTIEMLKAQECRQILLNCPRPFPPHVREYIEQRIRVYEAPTREAYLRENQKLIELQGHPT